ncbi:MAG TPA: LysM peptidoglycan-binding domain-containing protein, partial [Nitrospira sp.]|nr:LysM peptidoglycan-binding domain-containing protein [Nitrospira sp.]HUM39070.1 LysM peptidoglycan-binding domain-containing protein [Nitrospira sp.]
YEARNRELSAQVEAVRQQAAQIQEEAQAMKEASLLEKRAQEDMKRLTTIPKAKKAAPKKDFAAAVDEALKTDVPADMSLEQAKDSAKDVLGRAAAELESAGTVAVSTTGTTHTVRPGETLYRIGQKYHVGLDQLRKWNNMSNNTVVVGQKLVVSQP